MLANRVRDAREARAMTQQALAEAVGVTRQTIIAVEKSKFGPSVALALALARVLGATVEELFWLDDVPTPTAAIPLES
jgi:putative transcriptional regulator